MRGLEIWSCAPAADTESLERGFELGGDEREAGAHDGSTFAGAGQYQKGHGIVCRVKLELTPPENTEIVGAWGNASQDRSP